LYYQPIKPFSTQREINILDAINNIYSDFPSYGYRRITKQVQRDGYNVGKKLVKKAMRYMGIKALYPKPRTTIGNKEHYKYPYLLKTFRNDAGQVIIDKVNKVWSTDITYIKLETGFVYLAAIIDWHSKAVLSWEISNCMDVRLVMGVLYKALATYGKPEIFNTDQGSQYTSLIHTQTLKDNNIIISMDGKGRATDNICIERFWRSAKCERIYLNEYFSIKELTEDVADYIEFYNHRRFHETLNYQKPMAFYLENLKVNDVDYVNLSENVI
jgi:putative transposase